MNWHKIALRIKYIALIVVAVGLLIGSMYVINYLWTVGGMHP